MSEARAVLGSGEWEVPASGRGPGVLVLSDSASASVRADACVRLAHHGFVAWAPPLPEAGDGEASDAERGAVLEAISRLFRLHAVEGARVGILGMGRGGQLGLDAAARSERVAVVLCLDARFGPGDVATEGIEARVLLLGAGREPRVAEGSLSALADVLIEGGLKVELSIAADVEAGFLDAARADRYDAGAERLAWDEALSILRAEL